MTWVVCSDCGAPGFTMRPKSARSGRCPSCQELDRMLRDQEDRRIKFWGVPPKPPSMVDS